MEFNNYRKQMVAKAIFAAQDLGLKSVAVAIESIAAKDHYPNESDHLTSLIVENINSAEDLEDLENSFDYAINQLRKAKEALSIL